MPGPQKYKQIKPDEHPVEKERSFIGSLFQDPQNMQSEVSDTALAYFDLNTRFRELTNSGNETAKQKKSFLKKKAEIEASWHSQTTEKVKELPSSHGSNTSPEYYASFDYSQLETLLKNSDRGGNSDAYNDVVTDLEVLTSKQLQDPYQSYALMSRLNENCRAYVKSKNPWSKTGKIRKAIIMQLEKKISAEMTTCKNDLLETLENSWTDYQKEKKPETINKACKKHFELISAVLQGLITIDDEAKAKYDSQMVEILKDVQKQSVGQDQNDTNTTKFFNSIGWTERKPVLVGQAGFDKAVKQSKYERRFFSCIQQEQGARSAIDMAKQLAGKGLHYLSHGKQGKGTYMTTGELNTKRDADTASEHAWTRYGEKTGSVQVTMTLNSKARIIDQTELILLVNNTSNPIYKGFEKTYTWMKSAEPMNAGGIAGNHNLSLFAALLGYNTIVGEGAKSVKYVNTFDRSALTILDKAIMRADSVVGKPTSTRIADLR